jgi:hypothetical protein
MLLTLCVVRFMCVSVMQNTHIKSDDNNQGTFFF